MNVSNYDYDLSADRIALHPPEQRGQSRLLVLDRVSGAIRHRRYPDIVDLLSAGDVVVINDTKVIKARLITTNSQGKTRELLLLEKHGHHDNWHTHKAIYKGTVREGDTLTIHDINIEVKEVLGGGIAVVHCRKDLLSVAQQYGTVPLPPYMKRDASNDDIQRYQTEFAEHAGSVAAPTASLNLTQEIIAALERKGVIVCHMTLHVGMGTFMPIRTDHLESHAMHKEYFEIPAETIKHIHQARQRGNRVVAIGTTVTRALEYSADEIQKNKAAAISGEADIFIYPGYEFEIVNALLTNFHAPKSTVLMMAAAFGGWENLKKAYEEAVAQEYAFLSYGDSMFIC